MYSRQELRLGEHEDQTGYIQREGKARRATRRLFYNSVSLSGTFLSLSLNSTQPLTLPNNYRLP